MLDGIGILRAAPNAKSVLQCVVALLNTKGGAVVANPPCDERTAKRTVGAALEQVSPQPHMFITVEAKPLEDGAELKINVKAGGSPPYFLAKIGLEAGGVWVLENDKPRQATEQEVAAMVEKSDGACYEKKRTSKQTLTFHALRAAFHKRGLPFGRPQMITLGLMGEHGLYTNLGEMLSDQAGYEVNLLWLKGEGNACIVKKQALLMGSLPALFKEITKRVNEGQSDDKPGAEYAYPTSVLHETLLHVALYMNHEHKRRITMRIYADRMELCAAAVSEQPGIHTLLRGSANDLCNHRLASIMERLQVLQCPASCIRTADELYAHMPKRYGSSWRNGCIQVTLPSLRQSAAQHVPPHSKYAAMVIDYLGAHTEATVHEMAERLVRSDETVSRLLRRMEREGYLKKRRLGKRIVYELSKNVYQPGNWG